MLSGSFTLRPPLAQHLPAQYALAHNGCVGAFLASSGNECALFVFEGNPSGVPFPAYRTGCLSESEYQTLKSQVTNWKKQALIIEWRLLPELTLEISRNHHASCGLYAVRKLDTIYLHWDPVQLYGLLEGSEILDRDQCAAFLSCRWHYGPDTLFKDIKFIPERCRLTLKEHDFYVTRPPAISALTPRPLKGNADPTAMLRQLLMDDISAYDLEGVVCSELSSGLDTTIIASVLAETIAPKSLLTIGYLPMGEDRSLLQKRRSEAVDRLHARDFCPPIESHYPSAFDPHKKHWPYEAPSVFEKEAAGATIAAAGGQIVFSGIGGDELCNLTAQEEDYSPSPAKTKAVDTLLPDQVYRRMQRHELPCWPTGLVPESGHDVANSISFAYLRHGVWYAHPFNSSELQTFAHFLPVEWRRNRKLSRDILRRYGYSDFFLQQTPKESLSASLDNLILGLPNLESFFENSLLASEGLIDLNKTGRALQLLATTRDDDAGLYLICWLFLWKRA